MVVQLKSLNRAVARVAELEAEVARFKERVTQAEAHAEHSYCDEYAALERITQLEAALREIRDQIWEKHLAPARARAALAQAEPTGEHVTVGECGEHLPSFSFVSYCGLPEGHTGPHAVEQPEKRDAASD